MQIFIFRCLSMENEFSKVEKNWGNNVDNRPLDYKYKTLFKSKRNWEKLIDGWDVKIEKNWGNKIKKIHSP
jgi:hypothetical protein